MQKDLTGIGAGFPSNCSEKKAKHMNSKGEWSPGQVWENPLYSAVSSMTNKSGLSLES